MFLRISMGFLLMAVLSSRAAFADQAGFQVNRYEPTAAGEWSFSVDHPWYTPKPSLSFGLSVNYAHNPLYLANRPTENDFERVQIAIAHQLTGHIDLAAAFFNRLSVSASLPITLFEQGNVIGGVTPIQGLLAGDPRFGAMVRLVGEPYKSPFSLHLGANVWIPTRSTYPQVGDTTMRVHPKVVLAGYNKHALWSVTSGIYYRPSSGIGIDAPNALNTMGSQFTAGAAVAYADFERGFVVGPEVVYDTVITEGQPFAPNASRLEVAVGGQYRWAKQLHIGASAGAGFLYGSGTPDFRAMLRIAYAPWEQQTPKKPSAISCPQLPDTDKDGVPDPQDECVTVPQGAHPDPLRPGCPEKDSDGDGLYDSEDMCPRVAKGEVPELLQGVPTGCPSPDRDKDGILNENDKCPDQAQGNNPDPSNLGCPLKDKDGDTVPDAEDACPDRAGAPNVDPKKNGCPSLASIIGGQIVIYEKVFFDFDKDTILPRSTAVLKAVGDILKARVDIEVLRIEGHTDIKGTLTHNADLSFRRARSVIRWLVKKEGILEKRLTAKGFGPAQPIADNKTTEGRAQNRRVEFHIEKQGAQ